MGQEDRWGTGRAGGHVVYLDVADEDVVTDLLRRSGLAVVCGAVARHAWFLRRRDLCGTVFPADGREAWPEPVAGS